MQRRPFLLSALLAPFAAMLSKPQGTWLDAKNFPLKPREWTITHATLMTPVQGDPRRLRRLDLRMNVTVRPGDVLRLTDKISLTIPQHLPKRLAALRPLPDGTYEQTTINLTLA